MKAGGIVSLASVFVHFNHYCFNDDCKLLINCFASFGCADSASGLDHRHFTSGVTMWNYSSERSRAVPREILSSFLPNFVSPAWFCHFWFYVDVHCQISHLLQIILNIASLSEAFHVSRFFFSAICFELMKCAISGCFLTSLWKEEQGGPFQTFSYPRFVGHLKGRSNEKLKTLLGEVKTMAESPINVESRPRSASCHPV